jgi:hypothetical protein
MERSRTMEATLQEITTLLDYLIKHNRDHAGEIMALAERAQVLGNTVAYRHIVNGVDLLNESNGSLQAALDALEA